MSDDQDDELDTDQKIRRSAARTFANWLAILAALGLIGSWAWTGIYYTNPGEAAVVLLLGRYHDTIRDEGLHWAFPIPLGTVETLNATEVRTLTFGASGMTDGVIADGDIT